MIFMLAIQAAGLSALIAFLFLIERPFQGVMAPSSEPPSGRAGQPISIASRNAVQR